MQKRHYTVDGGWNNQQALLEYQRGLIDVITFLARFVRDQEPPLANDGKEKAND